LKPNLDQVQSENECDWTNIYEWIWSNDYECHEYEASSNVYQ